MKKIMIIQFAVLFLVGSLCSVSFAIEKDPSQGRRCPKSVNSWYKNIQMSVKAQGHSLEGKSAVISLDELGKPAALDDDCIWVCCDKDSGLYTPGCDYFCKECD